MFLDNILTSIGYKIDKPERIITSGFGNSYPQLSNDSRGSYGDAYGAVASVYRCVRAIQNTMSALSLKVYDADTDEEYELSKIKASPDLQVFIKPNKWQTYYDFWEMHWGYMELQGECPWLLIRNSLGLIRGIYPLKPSLIEVIPSATDFVEGYVFYSNGENISLEPQDIHFWKYFNPNNLWRGLSPIQAAEMDVNLEIYALRSNISAYKHGARPSGAMITKLPATSIDVEELEDKFNKKYAGYDKYGKVVFVSGGDFTFQPFQLTNKDMQTIEQRGYSDAQVGQVYGVPPAMRMQFKDSSVIQNTEIQNRLYWDNTILPKMERTEQIMNQFIVPQTTLKKVYVKFDQSEINSMRKNLVQLAQVYQMAYNCGAATPNMIIENVLGKPPVDDPAMDSFYSNPMMLPSTQLGKSTNELTNKINHILQSTGQVNLFTLSKKVGEIKDLAAKNKDIEIHIKSRAQFNRLSLEHRKSFSKKLGELFQGQKEEVLKKLNAQKSYKAINPLEVQFDFDVWVKKFKDVGKPEITAALQDAMRNLANEVGETNINLSNQRINNYIGSRVDLYAGSVNDTSKNAIDRILADGVSAGLSIDEMAIQISTYFDIASKGRAQTVAQTEVVTSMNFGRLESMGQLGYNSHRWVTQRDSDVRESHASADGQVVRVGEEFTDLGADYNGDRTYPSDYCERCFTIPVKDEE